MRQEKTANERPDNKKQVILDAAETCLKERGLENINMREIAKEAKVSLGTINYYFPTKGHILMNIFKGFVKKVLKTVHYDDPDIEPMQRLIDFVNGFLTEFIKDPTKCQVFLDLWSHTTNNSELRELMQDYYRTSHKWLADLLEEGNKTGDFRVADPAATAAHFFAIIDGLKVQLHLLGMDQDLERFKSNYEKFIKQNLYDTPSTSDEQVVSKEEPVTLKGKSAKGDQGLFDLAGKVVIVTGGSTGLGFMMAEGLAEAGANIVLCARNLEQCDEAAKKISQIGVDVLAVRCDVIDTDDVNSLMEKTISRFGRIDVLINNAGYVWEEPLESVSLDKWNHTMNTNVTGTFLCSQAAGKHMIEQGGGKIINISSIAGIASTDAELADDIPYSASKGAINAFTRDLARKWCNHNINVNAIAPGFFATKMSKYIVEHRHPQLMNAIPMKRLGEKDEIKGVAVFLASSASNYITGQILAVDGGALA